jgi:FlaA1/EpsC-like NDP-sugar epimerase
MRILGRVQRISRNHILVDVLIIFSSLYLSLLIRTGWPEMGEFLPVLNRYAIFFVLLRMGALIALGVYNIIWRYISASDAFKLVRATALSSALLISVTYLMNLGHLPRAMFLIDALLVTLLLGGVRVLRRLVYEKQVSGGKMEGKKTLIYGAGQNGRSLLNYLNANPQLNFSVVGFIDDDSQKLGKEICGREVLGDRSNLAESITMYRIEELILGISSPSAALLKEVIDICNSFQIKPRLVRDVMAAGEVGASPTKGFRDVELKDLLNRHERQLETSSIREMLRGKRVLITGGGGSIGSELARQVLTFGPSQLLVLDHSELNLYQIDRELKALKGCADLVIPLLVDVKDSASLKRVLRDYAPDVVFHAAAYKHVHLVESNPFPAILNNILGTKNLVDLSLEVGVETFVLISTDKAVNPAGIMGATKRVCEMIVSHAGKEHGKRYCSVRFGNVLGSSGSLIPLLKEQIKEGGPVTITHPEINRYFMLIPEAVALVLRAATVAQPSDIALLRMGEPIKIVDIAKNLIALMGKQEHEVPIQFTGLRPGEKLFEELYITGNEAKTEDPDILIVPKGDQVEADAAVRAAVDRIISLAQESNREALYELSVLVKSNYIPPAASGADPGNYLLFLSNQRLK